MEEERFKTLVQTFLAEHFFDIARTDSSRIILDVPVIRVTYRDERRIHEVVDAGRRSAQITRLENRFKSLTGTERYEKPSVSLYGSLLKAGWNINSLGADHQNALSSAVLHRDLESARFLLQQGSTITPEAFGYAPLGDGLAMTRLLIDSANKSELTPELKAHMLVQAVRFQNPDLVPYLLDLGASPNLREPGSGLTALMSAVQSEQLNNVALLLAKGADPNLSDDGNHRPLWYAAGTANTGLITLLLQSKAEVNAIDNQGQTALMKAASYCYTWNIEALLKAGADPAIRDKRGQEAQPGPSQDPKCNEAQNILRQHRLVERR